MKIKNTAAGPRGVALADGTTRYLEPGETADLDVAKGHQLYEGLKPAKAAADDDGPKALSAMNKAELLEAAKDDGVTKAKDKDGNEIEVADGTNAQIIAAIEEARAAKQ